MIKVRDGHQVRNKAAPYRWRIAAGKLPVGLALGPDGTIAGTAASPATAEFTVTVTDTFGASATTRDS